MHGEPGADGENDDRGSDGFGSDGSDGFAASGASRGSGADEGVVVPGGFGATGSGTSGSGGTGFGRRIEDADTDEYVVVNGG